VPYRNGIVSTFPLFWVPHWFKRGENFFNLSPSILLFQIPFRETHSLPTRFPTTFLPQKNFLFSKDLANRRSPFFSGGDVASFSPLPRYPISHGIYVNDPVFSFFLITGEVRFRFTVSTSDFIIPRDFFLQLSRALFSLARFPLLYSFFFLFLGPEKSYPLIHIHDSRRPTHPFPSLFYLLFFFPFTLSSVLNVRVKGSTSHPQFLILFFSC